MSKFMLSVSIEVDAENVQEAARSAHVAFKPAAETLISMDSAEWFQGSEGGQAYVNGAAVRLTPKGSNPDPKVEIAALKTTIVDLRKSLAAHASVPAPKAPEVPVIPAADVPKPIVTKSAAEMLAEAKAK